MKLPICSLLSAVITWLKCARQANIIKPKAFPFWGSLHTEHPISLQINLNYRFLLGQVCVRPFTRKRCSQNGNSRIIRFIINPIEYIK